jgi:phage FluMu protein gp41
VTLSTQQTKVVYAPDGVQTEYQIPFPYYDKGIECLLVDARGTEDYLHGYTLAVNPSRVVFAAPPQAGVALVVRRATKRVQLTDYPVTGRLPAKAIETDVDRLTAMIQEIDEVLSRAVVVDATQDEAPSVGEIYARLDASVGLAEGFARTAVEAAQDARAAARKAAQDAWATLKPYLEGAVADAQAAALTAEELLAAARAAEDMAARKALAAEEAARRAIEAVESIPGFMDGAHSFIGLRAEGFELFEDRSEDGDEPDAADYLYMTVLPAGAEFRMDDTGNLRLDI